jgi:RimJ/RimL family protein N-acetyltransferase
VNLRPVAAGDAERAYRWANDAEIAALTHWVFPRSQAVATAGIGADAMDSYTRVRLAVDTKDGTHIGTVSLWDSVPEERSAQFGVTIGERDYWSRGYGREATLLMLRFGFGEMNLHRIWLQTWSFNERAIAAYRKIGFVEEARLREDLYINGAYHDNVVMSILQPEFDALHAESGP